MGVTVVEEPASQQSLTNAVWRVRFSTFALLPRLFHGTLHGTRFKAKPRKSWKRSCWLPSNNLWRYEVAAGEAQAQGYSFVASQTSCTALPCVRLQVQSPYCPSKPNCPHQMNIPLSCCFFPHHVLTESNRPARNTALGAGISRVSERTLWRNKAL